MTACWDRTLLDIDGFSNESLAKNLDYAQNPSMSPIAVTNIILNLTVVSGDEVEGR
jgi:hypothetical protein